MIRDFVHPASFDEALAVLAERPNLTVLAGGTDVMVQTQNREIDPPGFLYIAKLDGLTHVHSDEVRTRIGPCTTHTRLASSDDIRTHHAALAEACMQIGGWQTQNAGTLGGNICNASPAADTMAPLLIADAEVVLRSTGGRRRLPLSDFVLGRRRTALRPGEVLQDIELRRATGAWGECYLKVAPRTSMEVAVVGLAVGLTVSEGVIERARVAACSVAEVPFRSTDTERLLEGSTIDALQLDEAVEALTSSASPISDARAPARYRFAVIGGLLRRAVQEAITRCERKTTR